MQNNGLPCLLVFCHAVFLASGHFSMIPASLSTFWPVLTPFVQTCIRRYMTVAQGETERLYQKDAQVTQPKQYLPNYVMYYS